MSAYRENLIDRMIRIYGFEDPIIINFCAYCENWENNDWNDKILTILVESHEANPIFSD